jgi:RNA polymerase sigma-70 factor (ECF subfamily)
MDRRFEFFGDVIHSPSRWRQSPKTSFKANTESRRGWIIGGAVIQALGARVHLRMQVLVHGGDLAPLRRARPQLRRRAEVRIVHSRSDNPDVELILAVARGDRDAFAKVFTSYAPRVKSYLIRLGAPPAAAEEMAQDALLSVWRRAASFDPGRAGVSTWIFVIARNCWIDRLRRERVELAYRAVADEPEDTPPEADEAVMRAQLEEQVSAAMDHLTDDQRAVVQLSFFEDKSHSEIAEALSAPLGTVKSRLRLAMAKLRAQLERLQ